MERLSSEVIRETKACNTVCCQSMVIDSFSHRHHLGENAILKNSEKLQRECHSMMLSGWVKSWEKLLLLYWAKVIHQLFLCSQFETVHRKVNQNTFNFASCWLDFFVWTGVVWRSPIICDHVYVQSKSLWSTAVSWSFTYRESFLFLPLTTCSYVRGKISCFGLNWCLIICAMGSQETSIDKPN